MFVECTSRCFMLLYILYMFAILFLYYIFCFLRTRVTQGDDFEFYVEPNHKTGNLYWSIILKCVVVVAFALLYTLGVMFFFTMPEEMERSAVGLSIFAVTLFFSFLLTFLIVWWMCNSIMEDGGHSEPNVYSGVLNADLMREVYSTAAEPNTYFRKIPFTSELKAVQYER